MNAAIVALALLSVACASPLAAHEAQAGTKPVITIQPPQAPASDTTVPGGLTSSGTVDPNYVIGPGDNIEVNVFNEPKFSGPQSVRPDGMITMPLLGDVSASGSTPTQLSDQITSLLKKLITDPRVTVGVLAINSKHIYMVGEVGHVGPLAMTPGMTPLQAIATAGGLGPYANAKHIYILRTVNGKQEKIPFNYKKAIKFGDMQGVTLVNGDTIVIP